MKVNLFEGARRVSLLLKVVWVIGCAVVFWNESPYVSRTYELYRPSEEFYEVEDCTADGDREYKAVEASAEKSIHVTLCFKAHAFDNGSMLVPYREEAGRWWGNNSYSTDVSQYTKRRASEFVLPTKAKQSALVQWKKERWNQAWSALGFAIGGGVVLMIATAIIGWVVRGFVGIPSGEDYRIHGARETE